MAYNKSKSKGTRVEYEVRQYFRGLGMEAHRVPASGAAQGFPGDVLVRDGSKNILVEVKARRDEFKHIYRFMDKYKAETGKYALHFYDFHSGRGATASYIYSECRTEHYVTVEMTKDHERILKLKDKYLGKADLLVLKQDRKPLLFIRFL